MTAFIGSPRRGRTLKAVEGFEKKLKQLGEIDFEYIWLKDRDLKSCRGCGICLERGEELCPLKDDRDDLFQRMRQADGVIFATPVYSLQVTALLKNMLDRFSYLFHRPCFFHKTFMPIVVQGVYGMGGVLKYLDEVARFWGFKTCPGLGLTISGQNLPPGEQEKIDQATEKAAARFYRLLNDPADPVPSIKDVLIFRSVRTIHSLAAGLPRDHEYYKERGWFATDYYYPTRLGWLKRLVGAWADRQALKQARKIKSETTGSNKY
ncbi:MAG: flavodoxin family protein [Firmicutes bacterium]|nr:flavodoxin family protein [Bacillota bacterium]